MNAGEIILNALARRNKTQRELAAALGLTEPALCNKLHRSTLTADEFIRAAECLDYKLVVADCEDGEELRPIRKGIGPRVKKVIDGVLYDTDRASALCHTEPESGWWLELYEHSDGSFFVAHYTDWAGAENFITLCPPDEAQKLIAANSD